MSQFQEPEKHKNSHSQESICGYGDTSGHQTYVVRGPSVAEEKPDRAWKGDRKYGKNKKQKKKTELCN